MNNTKERKSVYPVNIGTPQVQVRKTKRKNQQSESLSDWEHAS
ncbi:MAG: hypothetical protein ACKPFD_20495 [Dolichospermum sp.]